jgi:hypothetical protein
VLSELQAAMFLTQPPCVAMTGWIMGKDFLDRSFTIHDTRGIRLGLVARVFHKILKQWEDGHGRVEVSMDRTAQCVFGFCHRPGMEPGITHKNA